MAPNLTDPNRGILTAIREALDVPRAPDGEYEKSLRLRHDRAMAVLGVLDGVLDRGYTLETAAESLRHACGTYLAASYATAQAEAPSHLDICVICGPGCCAPVLGVHTSCPGPLVGRKVESAR